ncbi:MAG: hypothetical protein RSJ41_11145 [Clostridia bacterium]
MNKQRRSPIRWLLVLLVVVLLSGGAVWVARGIVNRNSNALRTVYATPAYANQPLAILGEGILYYDNQSLHALDSRGRQIWNYAAGTNAGFSVDTGGVSVWSGSTLSILSRTDGKTLFSGNVEEPVLAAHAGTIYYAVQTGTEHNSSMLILDASGRRVDNILLKNQTVLDFGFFNNDARLWVMSLNTEGTVPMCSISTYRPGKTQVGAISDSQQVLYEVVFQSSKIRAVGTTHIKDYNYSDGKELTDNRLLVYGWYLMAIDDSAANPMMVFVPTEQSDGATAISDLRMIRGQIDQPLHLPYPAMQVLALSDTVYAYTNQYVMVAGLGKTTPDTYVLPIYVENVLGITSNKTAVVASGGTVSLIPMP